LGPGLGPLFGWMNYSSTTPDPIVYGVPLTGDTRWFLSNIGFQLAMVSNILLLMFIQELFRKPSKLWVNLYTGLSVLWMIATTYYGIFIYGIEKNYPAEESSVSFLGNVTFLLFSVVIYFLIFWYFRVMSDFQKDPVLKTGSKIVSYGGIAIILTYVLFVIDNVMNLYMSSIVWLCALMALVVLYLGYTMPNWLQKRIVRQIEEEL
jgi:hypothetical protein